MRKFRSTVIRWRWRSGLKSVDPSGKIYFKQSLEAGVQKRGVFVGDRNRASNKLHEEQVFLTLLQATQFLLRVCCCVDEMDIQYIQAWAIIWAIKEAN